MREVVGSTTGLCVAAGRNQGVTACGFGAALKLWCQVWGSAEGVIYAGMFIQAWGQRTDLCLHLSLLEVASTILSGTTLQWRAGPVAHLVPPGLHNPLAGWLWSAGGSTRAKHSGTYVVVLCWGASPAAGAREAGMRVQDTPGTCTVPSTAPQPHQNYPLGWLWQVLAPFWWPSKSWTP